MIVTQVALSVAFLPTAISEAWESMRFQPVAAGFAAQDYLAVRIETDSEASAAANFEEIRRRVVSEAGVVSVTFADRLPGLDHPQRGIAVDGVATSAAMKTHVASVDVNYFDALSAPILAGRSFHSGDAGSTQGVVVPAARGLRIEPTEALRQRG